VILRLAVLVQCRLVTDRQTDRRTEGRQTRRQRIHRASIAGNIARYLPQRTEVATGMAYRFATIGTIALVYILDDVPAADSDEVFDREMIA